MIILLVLSLMCNNVLFLAFTIVVVMQRVGNVVVAMQKMKNLVLHDQDLHKSHENEGDKPAETGATGGPP